MVVVLQSMSIQDGFISLTDCFQTTTRLCGGPHKPQQHSQDDQRQGNGTACRLERAPPSPLGCRCRNAGSGIVLLISLREDSVMGRSWDKELTDC